jgi:hypothetical protein
MDGGAVMSSNAEQTLGRSIGTAVRRSRRVLLSAWGATSRIPAIEAGVVLLPLADRTHCSLPMHRPHEPMHGRAGSYCAHEDLGAALALHVVAVEVATARFGLSHCSWRLAVSTKGPFLRGEQ